ncbi:MAG: hypothetical protein EOO77_00905, partial [Oxalobacteraceae bacterium]
MTRYQQSLISHSETAVKRLVTAAIILVAPSLFPVASTAQERKLGTVQKLNDNHKWGDPVRLPVGKSSSGWLKFEFYAGNRILIPVVVNGQPVVALLDSAASSTVLDRAFTKKLGLTVKGALTGGADGGAVAYGNVTGVDIKIGDLQWAGVAVAIDLAPTIKRLGRPLPIILGGEVFRETVIEIDFSRQRIAFH